MQSIFELLTKKRVDDLILDIERGDTCVLMKPKGVKILVSGNPELLITDKYERKLDLVDLLSSNLYIGPYMHIHRIKSKLILDESYEIVYNYTTDSTYLTSIKHQNEYINDYKTLFHRSELYGFKMPVIDSLSMHHLVSLIQEPDVHFRELGIHDVANSVLFLNHEYQALLENPKKDKNKIASMGYQKLTDVIFNTKPDSLPTELNSRFLMILDWSKKVRVSTTNNIKELALPEHVTTLQEFTTSFLPDALTKFLNKDIINVVIFRSIMMILAGKGYNKSRINRDRIDEMIRLSAGLDWSV